MKKNGFSIGTLLLLMFLYSILWWIVMCVIDCNVPQLTRIHHHISGEVWFQLIGSWLLALPSFIICAYALIQTKKYHDLDEERLRSELLMESAQISMCMVNWDGFDQWASDNSSIGVLQQEAYQRYWQKHRRKESDSRETGNGYNNLGFLDFRADLILKSGESVRNILW